MCISHSVMEGQQHNNPLNPHCFCLQRPSVTRRRNTPERPEVGTVHMCLTCVSGYRPLINLPPSLGKLLLDITLFNFIPVSFSFLLFLGLGQLRGKTVEYNLNPIGSSQVGMLYIVGKLSPNATRIYTFRRHCFLLTAFIARKRQSLFLLFAITH